MTTQWKKDDLFYVCSMIEYVARKTHNKVKDVVEKLTDLDLLHQLKAARVNHCLSYEQVCDEWIEEYGIAEGTYDNTAVYRKPMPTETTIGRIYQKRILDVMVSRDRVVEAVRRIYETVDGEETAEIISTGCYRAGG